MQSPECNFTRGSMFADRYQIDGLLGQGGMGQVYLVKDTILDELVALKVLLKALTDDENLSARFLREVQLTRKITHPNVVRTFEIGQASDRLYFTMEYVKGQTLNRIKLSPEHKLEYTITWLKEICEGLSAIHSADIIHRDLKPSNIIITVEGRAKITDFGVARPGISNLTAPNEVVGSAPFIPPESWRGEELTPASDIYALGILAYQLLTGNIPFDAEGAGEIMVQHLEELPVPPYQIVPEIPVWLSDTVILMLEKDPAQRPQKAEDLVEMLNSENTFQTTPIDSIPEPKACDATTVELPTLNTPEPENCYVAPTPTISANSSLTALSAEARKATKKPKELELPPLQRLLIALPITALIIGLYPLCSQFIDKHLTPISYIVAIPAALLLISSLAALPVTLVSLIQNSWKATTRYTAKAAAFSAMLCLMIYLLQLISQQVLNRHYVLKLGEVLTVSAGDSLLRFTEAALLLPYGNSYVVAGMSTPRPTFMIGIAIHSAIILIYLNLLWLALASELAPPSKKQVIWQRLATVIVVALVTIQCFLQPYAAKLLGIRNFVKTIIGVLDVKIGYFGLACSAFNWSAILCITATLAYMGYTKKRQAKGEMPPSEKLKES